MHRSVRPGTTMEVDFGESWAEVAGNAAEGQVPGGDAALLQRVFRQGVSARAARVAARRDRVGVHAISAALVDRVVLDNTSSGGQGGAGRPGPACRPRRSRHSGAPIRSGPSSVRRRRGWEKGSVETGVKYVRNLVFRPRAGDRELGGAQCAAHHGVGGRPADAPP